MIWFILYLQIPKHAEQVLYLSHTINNCLIVSKSLQKKYFSLVKIYDKTLEIPESYVKKV